MTTIMRSMSLRSLQTPFPSESTQEQPMSLQITQITTRKTTTLQTMIQKEDPRQSDIKELKQRYEKLEYRIEKLTKDYEKLREKLIKDYEELIGQLLSALREMPSKQKLDSVETLLKVLQYLAQTVSDTPNLGYNDTPNFDGIINPMYYTIAEHINKSRQQSSTETQTDARNAKPSHRSFFQRIRKNPANKELGTLKSTESLTNLAKTIKNNHPGTRKSLAASNKV